MLLAYVKAGLSAAMLASDLPDDPAFAARLPEYFPRQMRDGSPAAEESITAHPLAREIVTTETVNEVVNGAGITYAFRLEEEMAATPDGRHPGVHGHHRGVRPAAAVGRRSPRWTTGCRRDCQDSCTCCVPPAAGPGGPLVADPPAAAAGRAGARSPATAQPVADLTPATAAAGLRIETRERRAGDRRADRHGRAGGARQPVAYSLYTFSLLDVVDVAAETGRDLLEVRRAVLRAVRAPGLRPAAHRGHRPGTRRPLARAGPAGAARRPVPVAAAAHRGRAVHHVGRPGRAATRSRSGRARTPPGWPGRGARWARSPPSPAGDLAALSVAAREIRSMIR